MNAILPSTLRGHVEAPPSKNQIQRMIALATISAGETRIETQAICRDVAASLRTARALGMNTAIHHDYLLLARERDTPDPLAPCGESGLAMRLFANIAALFNTEIRLTAAGSLARRPMAMLDAPLRQLGATCESAQGLAPILVRGPLRGGEATVDTAISAQALSGLLIALTRVQNDSLLRVTHLSGLANIQLTLDLLEEAGLTVQADWERGSFAIPGNQRPQGRRWKPVGDWNAAATWLCAGALEGPVTVTGLEWTSSQSERRIVEILQQIGARVETGASAVTVQRGELRAFDLDLSDCPYLAAPLCALAAHIPAESRMTGLARLHHKESNRIASLISAFDALGVRVTTSGDDLRISGGRVRGATVDSHGDHRVAMAVTIAASKADDRVVLLRPESVAKSYPRFFGDLLMLNGLWE